MMEGERCRSCLGVIERLGRIWSTICRWLWGVDQAAEELDDEQEAQEIEEAREAGARFVLAVADATRDLPGPQRVMLQHLARRWREEQADVAAYDRVENELHRQIAHCAGRARAQAARLSHAADRAQAECANASGGITEPPWGLLQREIGAEE
ncbi:MAG: hypothetical protein ACOC7J_06190 [Armatimonadota bacterium]